MATFQCYCIMSCTLELPESLIEVVNDVWRPLVIEVGAYGSQGGISKIAASVIGPLADRDISIFCLSTNQEDYVMVGVLYCSTYLLYTCIYIYR